MIAVLVIGQLALFAITRPCWARFATSAAAAPGTKVLDADAKLLVHGEGRVLDLAFYEEPRLVPNLAAPARKPDSIKQAGDHDLDAVGLVRPLLDRHHDGSHLRSS